MTTKQRSDLTNQREVLAASKNEIDAIHNYLKKEPSSIYADIWKIGVNLSLRIGDGVPLLTGRKYTLRNLSSI